ncbi:MAG TPA: substrate-binding domain-containing protein [Candidatus Limnocylindria bacterium]|nr:substrate-binding domain-containing protein [Candidatus Limnocylindria bacterium]
MRNRVVALAAIAALAFGACNQPAASAGPTTAAGCVVGVSWNNYTQERWAKADEPNIQKAVTAGGGSYIRADAGDNSEQQLTDIDNLIAQGADVLIILAKDAEAIKPAIDKAKTANIPVIAYDRLIEDPYTFYITFDNKRVGTIIAEEVMKAAPSGNYVIIKGDPGDANAEFLRTGMTEAGIPALDQTANGITVVFEQNTANWDTTGARTNMEAALAQNNNDVDAVLSQNDGMATGVIQALQAVGLNIPVGGQDGDKAALNRVALGTQTVSVWKNANALGETAGSVAIQLCNGTAGDAVKAPSGLPTSAAPSTLDAVPFTTPGGNTVNSITLNPTPITKDNVSEVVDAGWVTKEEVCAGVTAGSVAPC